MEDLETHTWTGLGGPLAPDEPTEVLEQVAGPGAPRRYLLQEGDLASAVLVGRSEAAHVQIASPRVSRLHFKIQRFGLELRVTNLSAANGILLNHTRVHAADLRDQDRLQAGDAVFFFRRRAG